MLPALYQPGAVGWRRRVGDTTERNGRGGCLTCLCVVRRLPPPPLFSHARQRNVGTRNSTEAPTPRQGEMQRSSDLVMEERGCNAMVIRDVRLVFFCFFLIQCCEIENCTHGGGGGGGRGEGGMLGRARAWVGERLCVAWRRWMFRNGLFVGIKRGPFARPCPPPLRTMWRGH